MLSGIRIGATAGLALALASAAWGQQTEAETGFGLQGTFSAMAAASTQFGETPRSGSLGDGGFRLMLYPTWKLSSHWTFYGALQAVSRPYYYSEFETQGHGVRGNIAQGFLSYSQVWQDASVQVKVGELSSAFGSFPLHYDDKDNPMVDLPLQYGYYGSFATLNSLAGVETDATWKRLDARAQFTNSSPANRRSLLQSEQYGDWAGRRRHDSARGFGLAYQVTAGLIWTAAIPSIMRRRGRRGICREARWGWMRNGVVGTGMFAANCRGS